MKSVRPLKTQMMRLCALSLALSMAMPAWSNGNFTLLEGDVRVQDAPATSATPVLSGNTVAVGSGSKAVMRMADGQVIAVSANSRFTIEDFKYQANAPQQGSTLLRLFTGSMRAVSGLIAKAEPRNFRVATSTATIGIRGTDFLIGIAPDGSMFVQVLNGTVELATAAGTQVAAAGSAFTISATGAIAATTATAFTALTATQFQTLLALNPALVAPVAGAAAGSAAVGAGVAATASTTVATVFVTAVGIAAAVGANQSSTTHHSSSGSGSQGNPQ